MKLVLALLCTWLAYSTQLCFGQYFSQSNSGTAIEDSTRNTFGAAWADYNKDGFPDLLIINDLGPNQFFENQSGTSFSEITSDVLVSDSSNSWAATWGDYDNDGYPDVFIANYGDEVAGATNNLYRNLSGTGFERVDNSGLSETAFHSASCSWLDVDNDGNLDMIVSNGMRVDPEPNEIYLGNGAGDFTAISDDFSLDTLSSAGLVATDIDFDGDQDILLAVDDGPNVVYRNDNGIMQKIAAGDLSIDPGTTRGISAGDIDGDGDFDAIVSNWANDNNGIYLNDGSGVFTAISSDATDDAGKSEGSNLVDVDGDMDLDLIFANFGQINYLYINDGVGGFTGTLSDTISMYTGNSVGCPTADFNKDGFADLFIAEIDKPTGASNVLLTNTFSSNNQLSVQLEGTVSNSSAIGAKVLVYADGKVLLRELRGQHGFGTANDLTLIVGGGSATDPDSLQVWWPSGTVSTHFDVEWNTTVVITEPNPSGIAPFAELLNVFPIPFDNVIHIPCTARPAGAKLIGVDGKSYSVAIQDCKLISSDGLPQGVYILVVEYPDGGIRTAKVIH